MRTLLLGTLLLLAGGTSATRGDPVRASRPTPEPPGRDPLEIYAVHCSPCHGERGRGDGPAARFFDPPPRDFSRGAFRLVSTTNGVPSDTDLFEVIASGVPGTGMLPFAHLPHDDLRAVIGVLRDFRRDGLRASLTEFVEDPAELEEIVAEDTRPGPVIPMGPAVPDTVDSRARGRLHYRILCASCHGTDGRGLAMEPRTTVEGHAIRPRDFTRGILKGGPEPRRQFQRIRAGMPGTPMPAVMTGTLDDDGVWDVVNYLGALIPSGAQALHDPVRWTLRVPRFSGAIPGSPDDPRFDAAPELHLALAPFRADEMTVPGATVRALHDGELIAFRISWPDATRDIPGPDTVAAPDGFSVRLSLISNPPVLPIPGQPLPLDRALWLAGPMPEGEDAIFDVAQPRFVNPDRVCIAPIGPEHVGQARWHAGVWTALMVVDPERAGDIEDGRAMPVSFAAFDGSLRRGPMPVAFSNWHLLRFE